MARLMGGAGVGRALRLVEEVDMRRMMPVVITAVMLSLLLVPPVLAVPQPQQDQEQQQVPERYEEIIVVAASRFEQLLFDVPVSITVISGVLLENSPAGNYADVLRAVPGINTSGSPCRCGHAVPAVLLRMLLISTEPTATSARMKCGALA